MTIHDKDSYPWHVVHGGAQDDVQAVRVASAQDCYRDRAPYGEYILYAAGDPDAVCEKRISILQYSYLAEVRVTFEEDLVADGVSDIEWCQEDAKEQGDAFVRDIWPSWQEASLSAIAETIFPPGQDFVMARSVLSVGPDHASWVEVTRIEADQPSEIALTFCRVEHDRLLEIKAVLKQETVPVGIISEQWLALIDRFQAIPYERLSGAKRIEPSEELDDLEIAPLSSGSEED